MLTSTKSIHENRSVQPSKIDALRQVSILYIGDSTFFRQIFQEYFINSSLTVDFPQAKIALENTDNLPDLIIIDIANDHLKLVAFKVWLRTHNFHQIPVIYNQAAIEADQVKLLFS